MKFWETQSGIKIFQIIKGRSNVYLVKTSQQTILIDTAKSNKRNQLVKKLHAFGVDKINWLILTHTHYDHCQNAAWLKENFQCQIAVHKNAEDYIGKGKTPLPNGTNLLTKAFIALARQLQSSRFNYSPFVADKMVTTKASFSESGLQVLTTPGHSSDSITVLIDNEIAIIGDTMFGVFPRSIFPPYADNRKLLLKQWEQLSQTTCQLFLPGHGKPIHRQLLIDQLKQKN